MKCIRCGQRFWYAIPGEDDFVACEQCGVTFGEINAIALRLAERLAEVDVRSIVDQVLAHQGKIPR